MATETLYHSMGALLHYLLGFVLFNSLRYQVVDENNVDVNRFVSRRCGKLTYVHKAIFNSQTLCQPDLVVQESAKEIQAPGISDQTRKDSTCSRHPTCGVSAMVKRSPRLNHHSTTPNIEYVAEADLSTQTDTRLALASTRGLGVDVSFSSKIASTNRSSSTVSCLSANKPNNSGGSLPYRKTNKHILSDAHFEYSADATVGSRKQLRSSKAPKVVLFLCMITPVTATQVDDHDIDSDPFPVLYFVVAVLCASLILLLALLIACVSNRGPRSQAIESFIPISTTVLSVLEVVMLYRSEFFPKLCLFFMIPSSCILFWALLHYWSSKLREDRRESYRKLCLPATLVFSIVVVAFLTIYNPFLDALAAVPVTMPFSGWCIYTYQSPSYEIHADHELQQDLQAHGRASGFAFNDVDAELGHGG